jgi:hypothetical protein
VPSSTPEFAREYKILLAWLLACLLACPYGNSTYMFFVRFLCTFCHVNLQESYLKLKRVAVHTNTIQIYRTGPHTKTHVGVSCFVLPRYASTDDMGSQAYYVKVFIVY